MFFIMFILYINDLYIYFIYFYKLYKPHFFVILSAFFWYVRFQSAILRNHQIALQKR